MDEQKNSKFKLGEEYLYIPGKNVDPVWLTYVCPLSAGMHRLFSSENPTLEYHVSSETLGKGDSKDHPKPEISVKFISISGGDESKKEAYNRLAVSRGILPLS